MNKTTLEIELLTPTYLGGGNRQPEFGIPPIKGLLRFWYRALNPTYREKEPMIFGDAKEHGSSPIGLRLERETVAPRLCHLQRKGFEKSTECTGTNGRRYQGLNYLSFPMGMPGGERTALAPSQKFKIDCVELKHKIPLYVTGGYAMSFWALLTLGGIGARSRRGFGSLRLVSINSSWKVANLLKQYPKIKTIDDWWKLLREGLKLTKKWYNSDHQNDHFHIGKGTRFLLLGSKNGLSFSSWIDALDDFGHRLRCIREEMSPSEKAAIGLPIQGKGLEVIATKSERGASPLLMRVVKVEDAYYNLVILSKSPTCESNENLKITKGKKRPYFTHVDYGAIDNIWNEWRDSAFYELEV